ncbi:hypothetical protein ACL03H_05450 [Saccharopolyspora sp. MS10]|uniref:hypothetical protein n=1 Tax=Saccharopolyspora sp. MS10 TaxID=3385973 RepID=UPI0039A236AF
MSAQERALAPRGTSTGTAAGRAPVPVRYRAGVVGEASRVVHQAVRAEPVFQARCGRALPVELVEVEARGAPCARCVALASLNLPAADRPVVELG